MLIALVVLMLKGKKMPFRIKSNSKMKNGYSQIDEILPGYLSGDLSDEDRAFFEEWRIESPENEALFQQSLKAWNAMQLLDEMEQFNSFEALKKINNRISSQKSWSWWIFVQRAAAILLLPLLVYSGYITFQHNQPKNQETEHVVMQTISSRQGMVTRFELADGTEVWLNSDSELQFPTKFTGNLREVKMKGEAYFKVAKNENQPFRVHAKDLNIEVLGTSFDVASYDDEKQAEVILVEGKVNLFSDQQGESKLLGVMHPNQRAIYRENDEKVDSEKVNVDKYIAWRDGNLIFREDKMEDVVKRLSRWFNVEIVIKDPEIKFYAYKANFRNETLTQVLELLKISAPIDYQIIENKLLPNGEFKKQKVYLMKKIKG